MTRTIKIGKLTCSCFAANCTDIAYILTPLPLDTAMLADYSRRFHTSIVSISGIDWDDDLTPWTARGAECGDADFKGNAAIFLHTLCNDVIPHVEAIICPQGSAPTRSLIGISLSGLFAVWAWMQGNVFQNIASISGSFWYDDFPQWLAHLDIPAKSGRAYFSLGNKEGGPKGNPRFKNVAADTAEVISILKSHHIATTFEQTQGTHYAPIYPRLEKAFAALS